MYDRAHCVSLHSGLRGRQTPRGTQILRLLYRWMSTLDGESREETLLSLVERVARSFDSQADLSTVTVQDPLRIINNTSGSVQDGSDLKVVRPPRLP